MGSKLCLIGRRRRRPRCVLCIHKTKTKGSKCPSELIHYEGEKAAHDSLAYKWLCKLIRFWKWHQWFQSSLVMGFSWNESALKFKRDVLHVTSFSYDKWVYILDAMKPKVRTNIVYHICTSEHQIYGKGT